MHPMMHIPSHGLPTFMRTGMGHGPLVREAGAKPFQQMPEAGGKFSGGKDDASFGLPEIEVSGTRWVWNDLMKQWQRPHALVPPLNTLSAVASHYGNLGGWKAIRDVPQNKPIVGPNGVDAYEGDVILVPNLGQPANAYGDTPAGKTAGVEVPAGDQPPAGWPDGVAWPPAGTAVTGDDKGDGTIIPVSYTLPTDMPADWPTDQPWPPVSLVGTGNGAGGEEKFWTRNKMIAAGAVGVVVVGGVLYFVFRKKRRKNPHRRRRLRG